MMRSFAAVALVVAIIVGILFSSTEALFPIDLPHYETGFLVGTYYQDSSCTPSDSDVISYTQLGVCAPYGSGAFAKLRIKKSPIENAWESVSDIYDDFYCNAFNRTETAIYSAGCFESTDGTSFGEMISYVYAPEFATPTNGVLVSTFPTTNQCIDNVEFSTALFYGSSEPVTYQCDGTTYTTTVDSSLEYRLSFTSGEGEFLSHMIATLRYNPSICGSLIVNLTDYVVDCAVHGEAKRVTTVGNLLSSDIVTIFDEPDYTTVAALSTGYLTRKYYEDLSACDSYSWQTVHKFGVCVPFEDGAYILSVDDADNYLNASIYSYANSDCTNVSESSGIANAAFASIFGVVPTDLDCRENFHCYGSIAQNNCSATNAGSGSAYVVSATAPNLHYSVIWQSYVSESDCLANNANYYQVSTFLNGQCQPVNSPLSYVSDRAVAVSGCSDETFTLTAYEGNVCADEVAPYSYESPRYTCAYIAGMGYVRASCNFAPSSDHKNIPRDAIYSLLLLLLLLPIIIYGLLYVCETVKGREASYQDTSAQAAPVNNDVPEEGDMEMN